MKGLFSVAAIALSFLGAGCAIHPLPEDVTGVPTYYIVRQIRCEARSAVIETAINGLINYGTNAGDPETTRIAREFQDGTRPIATFSHKFFRNKEVSNIVR